MLSSEINLARSPRQDFSLGVHATFPLSALQSTFWAEVERQSAQRGLADYDLELIALIGTQVERGYLVRRKDFQALDRELKRLRNRARRLVGKRLVVDGDRLITAYHATLNKQRRLLREDDT